MAMLSFGGNKKNKMCVEVHGKKENLMYFVQ